MVVAVVLIPFSAPEIFFIGLTHFLQYCRLSPKSTKKKNSLLVECLELYHQPTDVGHVAEKG